MKDMYMQWSVPSKLADDILQAILPVDASASLAGEDSRVPGRTIISYSPEKDEQVMPIIVQALDAAEAQGVDIRLPADVIAERTAKLAAMLGMSTSGLDESITAAKQASEARRNGAVRDE